MAWQADLDLDYTLSHARVVLHHRHSGPLRVLQSLYPEGDAVCHNVLVHPPGGLVGGDVLQIRLHGAAGTHALLTTPGATRFYRSSGASALQHSRLHLAEAARLEWLPMETLCYNDCRAENRLVMELAPGAELIGWDLTSLGLPQAQLPFLRGSLRQHIEVPGVWLERACIDASDLRLLHSPAGLGGHHCLASMFLVCGSALQRARLERLLDATRSLLEEPAHGVRAGVSSADPRVVVVRALAAQVEPVMQLLRSVRSLWRQELWQLAPCTPRLWAM